MLEEPSPLRLLPARDEQVPVRRILQRALELPRSNLDRIERGRQVRPTDRTSGAIVRLDVRPCRADLGAEARPAEEVLAPRDDRLELAAARLILRGRGRGGGGLDELATLLRGLLVDLDVLNAGREADGEHVVPALAALSTAGVAHEAEELDRARLADAVVLDVLDKIAAAVDAAVLREVLGIAHERHVDANLAKAEELLEDRTVVLHDRVALLELLEVVLVAVVVGRVEGVLGGVEREVNDLLVVGREVEYGLAVLVDGGLGSTEGEVAHNELEAGDAEGVAVLGEGADVLRPDGAVGKGFEAEESDEGEEVVEGVLEGSSAESRS